MAVLEVELLLCCLVQAAVGLSSSSCFCGSRSLVCRDYRGLGRSRGSLLFNSSSWGRSSLSRSSSFLSRCSLFLCGSLHLRSSGGHHTVSVFLRGVLGSKGGGVVASGLVVHGGTVVYRGSVVDRGRLVWSRGGHYLYHRGRFIWSWGGFVWSWGRFVWSWGRCIYNWGGFVRGRFVWGWGRFVWGWGSNNFHDRSRDYLDHRFVWSRGRLVSWGWSCLVRLDLSIDCLALVLHISNIALRPGGVGHYLDTTIREVDTVLSSGVVVCTVLLMVEDSARVLGVIHSILVIVYWRKVWVGLLWCWVRGGGPSG